MEDLYNGGGPSVVLNGSVGARVTGAYGQEEVYSAADLGGKLESIEIKRDGSGGYLAAIKIDGRLLIDPSVATDVDVVKVVSQDKDANTITVDGGTWTTSDNLVKETPYDTTLTCASDKDLDSCFIGAAFMTDETGDGPFTQTPYKLTTSDIENVASDSYWNKSQVWSNSLTVNTGSFSSGAGAAKAFNGDMSDNAATQTGGAIVTFTCPVAFPAGVKLEAKCNKDGGGSHWISVNGAAEVQYNGADVGAEGFHELPYQPGDEQAFVITFRNNNAGGGTDLTGIRIGGQLLVDTTVSGDGPSEGIILTFY